MNSQRGREFGPKELQNFATAIAEHGYAFQHRAIAEAQAVSSQSGGPWKVEVPEFPVETDRNTRIDLILCDGAYHLIVECKRVNPAYGEWLFLRAPSRQARDDHPYLIIESIQRSDASSNCMAQTYRARASLDDQPYQVGIIVTIDRKGNVIKQEKDALEQSMRQVARGASGFVNYRIRHPASMYPTRKDYVIPAVFTTAELVVSEIDLATQASLTDGTVAPDTLKPSSVPWVFFEYHTEPGLRHDNARQQYADDLERILERQYVRTIPIVSAASIKDFLLGFKINAAEEIKMGADDPQ